MARASRLFRGWFVLTGLVCALSLVCGCEKILDQRHPQFKRAMALLEQDRAKEAAEAFRKCLRQSPESAEPHLKLAVLYEDRWNDPASAIAEYRRYLEKRPEGKKAEAVRKWIARAEKAFARSMLLVQPSKSPQVGNSNPVLPGVVKDLRAELRRKDLLLRERQEDLRTARVALASANGQVKALRTTVAEMQKLHPPKPVSLPVEVVARSAKPTDTDPVHAVAKKTRDPQLHVVQEGDNLYTLSRRYYGTARYWPALAAHNSDVVKSNGAMRRGVTLRIPTLAEIKKIAEKE
ncbi:MAG: hypothetical protein KAI66_02700 [Lentisphaeria bacterium]|nr:hypothetical protein [Lentisphaeria bacterium]